MAEKQPVSASCDDSFFSAFVLREEHLSKINEIVRAFLDSNASVSFYFTCADRITREYEAVADARKYENHKDRAIAAIWISGTSEDRRKRISIRLANRRISNVSISMSGPGISVANYQKKVEEWLEGMLPWYSRFAGTAASFLLPLLVLLLGNAIVFGWLILSRKVGSKPFEFNSGFVLNNIISFAIGIVTVIVMNAMQSWLFPVAIFAVGQGVEREKHRSGVRSLILIVLLLGLVVGFAGSMIASYAFQAVSQNP